MIDRAVILARGLGTRMRAGDASAPLTSAQHRAAEAGAKAMMPVGRPFLDYILSALADAGVHRICLVVPPDHARMRDYYRDEVRPSRLSMEFAVQPEPRGTADAVLAVREYTRGEPFLVLNADNYYPVTAYRALAETGQPGLCGFDRGALLRQGNIEPARLQRYALLRVDASGFLEDLVEKPDDATFAAMGPHALVSMNLWSFPAAIFEACAAITPSGRGELELPDAVRHAMTHLGVRFRVLPVAEPVLDLATRSDIAAVTAYLRGQSVHL